MGQSSLTLVPLTGTQTEEASQAPYHRTMPRRMKPGASLWVAADRDATVDFANTVHLCYNGPVP